MQRRDFIAVAGGAMLWSLASPGEAHQPVLPDYGLPDDLLPREVRTKGKLAPFELHVDPAQFALYWTLPERRAIRYTVGIGRPGLYEAGEFFVGAKKEWPSWTPTPDMIRREPKLYRKFSGNCPA